MKWILEIVSTPNYLRVITEGLFSTKDQAQMFDEISQFEGWNNGTPILFDNRSLDLRSANLETIRTSVFVMQKFSTHNPDTRIAGLVNDGLNFGFGRQFETITELEEGKGFRLFKDENLAIDWLITGIIP